MILKPIRIYAAHRRYYFSTSEALQTTPDAEPPKQIFLADAVAVGGPSSNQASCNVVYFHGVDVTRLARRVPNSLGSFFAS